jgi:uncharacterized protein involved in outer membrane biogenesis
MSKPVKSILFVLCGLMILFALLEVGLLVVDTDANRTRLEAAISKSLAMEVRAGGGLGISLFPSLHLNLENLHLAQQGAEIASVEKLKVGMEFWRAKKFPASD